MLKKSPVGVIDKQTKANYYIINLCLAGWTGNLTIPPFANISQLYIYFVAEGEGKLIMAGPTRLELATSGVTGRRSNQTELRPHLRVK